MKRFLDKRTIAVGSAGTKARVESLGTTTQHLEKLGSPHFKHPKLNPAPSEPKFRECAATCLLAALEHKA